MTPVYQSGSIKQKDLANRLDSIENVNYEQMSSWPKWAKIYLVNAIKLCQFNPAGGEQDGFGPSIKRSQLPFWSHLADLFWLYVTIKLVIIQILQHRYSSINYELKLLNVTSQQAKNQTTKLSFSNEYESLQIRMEQSVADINMIGNPFYEMAFAIEPLFVFVLFIVYLAKVQNPLRLALRAKPFHIGLMQMLLDPQRERTQTTLRTIEELVGQILTSNQNYWLNQRFKILSIFKDYKLARWARPEFEPPGLGRTNRARENETAALMRMMIVSGELVPANRQREWLPQVARIYLGLGVYFTFLGVGIIVFLLIVLPLLGLIKYRVHPSARDLLLHIELVCYCLVGLQWVIFYLIMVITIALDQMMFVKELRRSIGSLIVDIRNNLLVLGQANLNRRLLRVVIQYKLFKHQLRATQPLVGFTAGHMVFLMLVLPIMGRLNASHLSLQLRWIHLACSVFFILCCDFLILPNCRLHSRCLDMFRELFCLLAHIDAVHHHYHQSIDDDDDDNNDDNTLNFSSISYQITSNRQYKGSSNDICETNGDTVWLLRRELHLPELALRQFATRAFFMRPTYASWLGVHFWCGLLLAPLLMHDTARLGSLGNPFADTLGFF